MDIRTGHVDVVELVEVVYVEVDVVDFVVDVGS